MSTIQSKVSNISNIIWIFTKILVILRRYSVAIPVNLRDFVPRVEVVTSWPISFWTFYTPPYGRRLFAIPRGRERYIQSASHPTSRNKKTHTDPTDISDYFPQILGTPLGVVIVSLARFDLQVKEIIQNWRWYGMQLRPAVLCCFKRLIAQASLALFLLNHHASSRWCCLPYHLKKLFNLFPWKGE